MVPRAQQKCQRAIVKILCLFSSRYSTGRAVTRFCAHTNDQVVDTFLNVSCCVNAHQHDLNLSGGRGMLNNKSRPTKLAMASQPYQCVIVGIQ